MKYIEHNLGDGPRKHAAYTMPLRHQHDYWASVTDVPCPACAAGLIRWYEAGGVPGSRICDGCGRYFQAQGSIREGITLVRDCRFDDPRFDERRRHRSLK